MFVRWKKKSRADYRMAGKSTPVTLHVAYLVKSERVNGKPRQKTVAYLASIKDRSIQHVTHRRYFWQRVQASLQPLHLSEQEQHAIEAKLLERVPMPTEEAFNAEMQQLERELRLINARLGVR